MELYGCLGVSTRAPYNPRLTQLSLVLGKAWLQMCVGLIQDRSKKLLEYLTHGSQIGEEKHGKIKNVTYRSAVLPWDFPCHGLFIPSPVSQAGRATP